MFRTLALAALMMVPAMASQAQSLSVDAKSFVVGSPATGRILAEHNGDERLAPASLTKLMTLYLLFDALDQGRVKMDQELPVSEKAWRKGGSKMFVKVGTTVPVDKLIRGIAVASGNDACIVVAEYLGGTEDGFADMMNYKAKQLGMTNTTFKNSSGWPDPEQKTTAADMFKLASALQRDFPEYYNVFAERVFTYSDIRQYNRNGLLGRNVGVDGIKTGHTEEAGFHLVASAKRGGERFTSVVMGTDGFDSREDESLKALTWAFAQYDNYTALEKGQPVATVPVWLGTVDSVKATVPEDVSLLVSNREKAQVKAEAVFSSPVAAPVKAGQEVGTVKITMGDEEVATVPLIAMEGVDQRGASRDGAYAFRYGDINARLD